MNERSKRRTLIQQIIEEDRQGLIELCLLLGRTPSPHGQEREVAGIVAEWFSANSIESWLQPITETSANALGRISGASHGPSLIMNAHLDVGKPLPEDAPERLQRIYDAWVDDELIYGKGVINDKGQLAAFMVAARALLKAGISLAGDLIIAGVAFETGDPSVGTRQGINFPGEGFGTWWLVNRGITADYALIGETSSFGLVTAECGALWLEIRTTGRTVYTPRLQRGSTLAEHSNSVVRMAEVVRLIEDWATDYESRSTVEFPGGSIVPKAQVVEVAANESESIIRVDIRIPPGANPRAITRDVAEELEGRGIACTVEPYQWSRGYIAQHAEPLIDAVTAAHREVFGSSPLAPPTEEVSMWRDLNMFNEVGIPSICYGPPRQRELLSDDQNRAMKIDDLVAATKVYALTALNVCGEADRGTPATTAE